MISLTAPLTLAATQGGFFAQKCHGKTCGFMGYFAVALMFAVLCGGVFMLLQSNFGVLQGYLISGVAFWASWFVLALIWFTGVPNVRIDYLPGIKNEIPRSTPRFMGPQGKLPSWNPITAEEETRLAETGEFISVAGTGRTSDVDAIKTAETAVGEVVSAHYAKELGTAPASITVPGIVLVDKDQTEAVRGGDSRLKYVKFITKAAAPGETASPEEKALISKIKPTTIILKLDKGTESLQTYIALPLTFGLFILHLFGLMWYERRHRPVSVAERERERVAANA